LRALLDVLHTRNGEAISACDHKRMSPTQNVRPQVGCEPLPGLAEDDWVPAALTERRPVELPAPPPRRLSFGQFCRAVGFPIKPFQRRIVKAISGPEREALILIARGQGKTTLLGTYAVFHLLTHPRPAVYCGAASVAQARILFEAASAVATHPAYADFFEIRHLEIRRRDGAGHLRVLPSNGPRVHGLTGSLYLCDELHAHRDDGLYIAMRSAMAKRPDARLVTITTAAPTGDTPLRRIRERALASPHVTRTGPLLEASGRGLRLLEWSCPEDHDPDDLAMAKKVNPAPWITPKLLAEQRDALPPNAWSQFHLNIFVHPEGHWLPAGAWQACIGVPTFTPRERIWCGVDIGGTEASSVVAWINAAGHVGVSIYHGEGGVLEVMERIRELAVEYTISECAYDAWHFGGAPALELERAGLTMVQYPQTDARLNPASQALRDAIIQGKLTLPDDPELADQAAHTIALQRRRGWRIDKANRGDNIDAIVALCMAWDRAQHKPEPVRLLGFV
jgi:phage terminase large subunit-like protein